MANMRVTLGFNYIGQGFFPSYTLEPEMFDIAITRNPSIVALPNQNGSNRGNSNHGTGIPKNICIDFGMMQETISISGKASDDDMRQFAANNVNNRSPMELLASRCRTQWVNMPTVFSLNTSTNNTGLIKVQAVQDVQGYSQYDCTWGCVVLRANFTRNSQLSAWDYRLVFGVVTYPEATSPNP